MYYCKMTCTWLQEILVKAEITCPLKSLSMICAWAVFIIELCDILYIRCNAGEWTSWRATYETSSGSSGLLSSLTTWKSTIILKLHNLFHLLYMHFIIYIYIMGIHMYKHIIREDGYLRGILNCACVNKSHFWSPWSYLQKWKEPLCVTLCHGRVP